ncbi:MAG: long-chain fatty acid--CoA ligase, partial [Kitasatospora sp.]|nr:long-chain fatty acid--CoA ligase [Kitasatospora sp.]
MSSAQSMIERRPPSVAHLLLSRVKATPNGEAYRYPVPVDEQAADSTPGAEQWRSLTWAQAHRRIT